MVAASRCAASRARVVLPQPPMPDSSHTPCSDASPLARRVIAAVSSPTVSSRPRSRSVAILRCGTASGTAAGPDEGGEGDRPSGPPIRSAGVMPRTAASVTSGSSPGVSARPRTCSRATSSVLVRVSAQRSTRTAAIRPGPSLRWWRETTPTRWPSQKTAAPDMPSQASLPGSGSSAGGEVTFRSSVPSPRLDRAAQVVSACSASR